MKSKIFFINLLVLAFLILPVFSYAATIFTDDFNSYTNSNIEGQGGWTGNGINEFFTVESNIAKEGSKAVQSSSNFPFIGLSVKKVGTLTPNGRIKYYFRAESGAPTGKLTLGEGLSIKIETIFNISAHTVLYRNSSFSLVSLGTFNADTWYSLTIEWRTYDGKVRYSFNDSDFTPYVLPMSPLVSGLDSVILYRDVGFTNARFYIDNITEGLNRNPVLIVPGLMGTEMKNGNELLWADLDRMVPNLSDNFIDPLQFKKDLSPSVIDVFKASVIKKLETTLGLVNFDYTDGLITEFKNQGYVEGENLFAFPYDWRYGVSGKYADNKTNVDLLAQKIQDILTQTGSDKIDIVAHSLGGLIVKKYVVDHPADHHIGKAIFVGVPNTGSPKSIKVLLQGDNFDIPWLSQNEIKKISENLPAAYDLLPSQQYYDTKGSFLKVTDEGLFDNWNDYTEKDLNYSEFGNFLTNDHSLNSLALTGAVNLHTADFDNFDLRTAGVDLYSINGCKSGTINNIIEHRFQNAFGQSFTDYKMVKFKTGDGTVSLESSTNLPIDQSHKFYMLTADHSKMMSQDGSRQEIVNLISGSTLEVKPKFITQDISKCNLNGKAISIFSPIDILVTDQNGNHLGIVSDGSIVNEIPNADFELLSEHKFLYLPTDDQQTYNIQIKGTGTGTYTINSQNIVNNEVINTEIFSNLPVTPSLTGQINLGTQTTLTIKQTPNSSNETILPSANLNAAQSEDVAPPVSVVTISGLAGQKDFYRSDLNIAISATDTISGVLALNYNIDGAGYQKMLTNSVTLTLVKEGNHSIAFFATDKAGNNEQEKTLNFTIDKTMPEATVQFDHIMMDLKFTGSDNISDTSLVVVKDEDNIITITDQAGNITEIMLKDKNRKKGMKAEITSLKYNGVTADINKNIMKYSWSLDKAKKLATLTQQVKSKKEYNILAVFDGKNTKVTSKDSSGKFSNSFSGLKIIKVLTNKGDFQWGY